MYDIMEVSRQTRVPGLTYEMMMNYKFKKRKSVDASKTGGGLA